MGWYSPQPRLERRPGAAVVPAALAGQSYRPRIGLAAAAHRDPMSRDFHGVSGEGLIAAGGPGRERGRRISTSRAGIRACVGTRLRLRLVRRAAYSTTYCRNDLTLVTKIFYKRASSPTTPEAPFRCRPASRGRRRRRARPHCAAVATELLPGRSRAGRQRARMSHAQTRGEQE